jgi:hypothetical protein
MDRATVDQLLTTTSTVRKRLDLRRPVEPAVIQECLELLSKRRTAETRTGITSSWSPIR